MSDLLLEPAEIPGSGNLYRLSIGVRQETDAAEAMYATPPSWKLLADESIEFCRDEGICLSYLASQGHVRRGGVTEPRHPFPDEVKIYIAEQVFKK